MSGNVTENLNKKVQNVPKKRVIPLNLDTESDLYTNRSLAYNLKEPAPPKNAFEITHSSLLSGDKQNLESTFGVEAKRL